MRGGADTCTPPSDKIDDRWRLRARPILKRVRSLPKKSSAFTPTLKRETADAMIKSTTYGMYRLWSHALSR